MSSEQDNKVLEQQRISLPKPDVNNITVLTKNLPNEPVLPWHRFDSPWLERENGDESSAVALEAQEQLDDDETVADETTAEQLTLELPEVENPVE